MAGAQDIDAKLGCLKTILQGMEIKDFEILVAKLIGQLLDVPIAVAKSGFQFGGDAGPAGRMQRNFRIEAKRYADNTTLSDRELLGEIDHALRNDSALEGWFLVATKAVSEQLLASLILKGEKEGLPIVVVDWTTTEFPALAALCSSSPEVVRQFAGKDAGEIAKALQRAGTTRLTQLKREMQSWHLGFSSLAHQTHSSFNEIWNNRADAIGRFGQDVAGAVGAKIRRKGSFEALTGWWRNPSNIASPALLYGNEGDGKTWAALDWVSGNITDLPILIPMPSFAFAGLHNTNPSNILDFLAERLKEITGARDSAHWGKRLVRLFQRPVEEGPVVLVCIDGMNQEPDVPWLKLLQAFQTSNFAGRVRIVATTRKHHFKERLKNLSGLLEIPQLIAIEPFDDTEGGELDQRLALDGLTRSDLHPDLISFARTPRLYGLVVKLRSALDHANEVTVHRLLWEYGRDSFRIKVSSPFSEGDWKAWLAEVAANYRNGLKQYATKNLGETVAQPDLNTADVYRRLSEIIDGQFLKELPSGKFTLSDVAVSHSLGAGLLFMLQDTAPATQSEAENLLSDWLDPISGLDERSEILCAAANIMLGQKQPASEVIAVELLAAWLSTQNMSSEHRVQLSGMARPFLHPLLRVMGCGDSGPARIVALNAIRSIPNKDSETLGIIAEHADRWLTTFSREVDPPSRQNADSEKHRSEYLTKRLGRDEDGEYTILGLQFNFVERGNITAIFDIPELLEGYPLASLIDLFERAAIANSLSRHFSFWDDLKWVILLNEIDFEETSIALKARSIEIRARFPEAGIHSELPLRVAALLLWLSCDEDNESEAVLINPPLNSWSTYENDYLPDPAESWYRLERRHISQVLSRPDFPIHRKLDRAKPFWLDPTVEVPDNFIQDLQRHAASFVVSKLYTGRNTTREDLDLEEMSLPLARYAPSALSALIRRKLTNSDAMSSDNLWGLGYHSIEHFILNDDKVQSALSAQRLKADPDQREKMLHAIEHMLLFEAEGLSAKEQFELFIEAGQKYFTYDPEKILKKLTSEDLDELIDRYGQPGEKSQHDLLALLSIAEFEYSDDAWNWVVTLAENDEFEFQALAFKLLNRLDGGRLGRRLFSKGWHWKHDGNEMVNHYGSQALVTATVGLPFEQIASSITPSLLPYALQARQGSHADSKVAVEILDNLLLELPRNEIDPGGKVFVDTQARRRDPGSFSFLPPPLFPGDPFGGLRAITDSEKAEEHRRVSVHTAVERIKAARKEGASLFLHSFYADEMAVLISNHPDIVDRWASGFEGQSGLNKRRMYRAEGFYLALCQELFKTDTPAAAKLWRSLRKAMHTRFIGEGEIEEMLHILFANVDKLEVRDLLDELYDLLNTNTDNDLFDLALAAQLNGRVEWLRHKIAEDYQSPKLWKRQRAQIMEGLLANNRLPINVEEGPADLPTFRRRQIKEWQCKEAYARHWWEAYWDAETVDEAYAAWVLFKAAADRRAYCWMKDRLDSINDAEGLNKQKLTHFHLNFDQLKKSMKKHEKDMEREFLRRKISSDVGPWRRTDF